MEQQQDHVCKFCNLSFLSGRILGGHMRNHLGRKNSDKEKVNPDDLGIEEGYVLRENPKKSWKSSGVNRTGETVITLQENVKCSVCGKEFGSPRSLHGHMRHHSVEERNGVRCKECGKGFRSLRSLTGHMRLHSGKQKIVTGESRGNSNFITMSLADSDTSVSLVRKKKRSNRMRYKANSATPNSSFSSLNESISAFEFEIEPDVEEVALSLMLLSRGFFELGEYEIGGNKIDDSGYSKQKMFECSDCKVEFEVPGLELYDDEIQNEIDAPEEVEFDVDDELKKMRNGFECRICKKKFATYQALGGHQTFHRTKSLLSLKIHPENETKSKVKCLEDDAMEEEEVRKEYRCDICCKNFETGQALGGHKRAHIAKTKEDGSVIGGSNRGEFGLESWWDGGSSYKQESLVVDVMVKANKNAVISF